MHTYGYIIVRIMFTRLLLIKHCIFFYAVSLIKGAIQGNPSKEGV